MSEKESFLNAIERIELERLRKENAELWSYVTKYHRLVCAAICYVRAMRGGKSLNRSWNRLEKAAEGLEIWRPIC